MNLESFKDEATGRWRYCDKETGEVVIDFNYGEGDIALDCNHYSRILFVTERDKDSVLINPRIFDKIKICNVEGLYIGVDYYSDENESYMYLLDNKGKIISDCYVYMSSQFVSGLCRVYADNIYISNGSIYGTSSGDGYIDTTGKQIIKLDNINLPDANVLWEYVNPLYGYNNNPAYHGFNSDYCDHRDFSEDGLAAIRVRHKEYRDVLFYGYINTRGEIAITPQYDYAGNFIDGIAKVKSCGETFYIDTQGKRISDEYSREAEEDDSCDTGSDNVICLEDGQTGKYGFIYASTSKILVPYIYDNVKYGSVKSESLEFCAVKLNEKWRFINIYTGMEVIPFIYIYEEVDYFCSYLIKLNGKWGFIDSTNRTVCDMRSCK